MSYEPSASEIVRLRLLTGENAPGSDWTAETLSGIISERDGDIYAAAYDVWMFKAAAMASNPSSFSADGGSYNFAEAYDRCLQEANRCLAMSPAAGGMIIDPTLEEVQE